MLVARGEVDEDEGLTPRLGLRGFSFEESGAAAAAAAEDLRGDCFFPG